MTANAIRLGSLIARIVVLSALGVAGAAGQSTYSAIQGIVSDEQGGLLPGVAVAVVNEETGLSRDAVTNERGLYRLANLPPGRYLVRAELVGFAIEEQRGIVLSMGSEISVDFGLKLAALQETVTVSGLSPLVETTQKALETNVTPQEVDSLPLKTRNFTDLALLAPGVGVDTTSANSNTDSISFGGFDERYKSTWLEGVDINDDVTRGGTTQSDAVRHSFSQESIQEFQVLANQYSAEFGRSGSGVINVLTKSGTNSYRGRAFYFLRDDSFDKKNALATGKVPFQTKQWGGTFGGPIRKDRLHFFSTFERRTNDDVVTVRVPAFARPMMKDPREELPRAFRASNVFAKITASLSAAHYLAVTGLYETFMRLAQNLGGTVAGDAGFNEDGYSFFLNPTLTSVLSPNLSNQARVAASRLIRDRVNSGPAGPSVSMPGIRFGQATNYPQSRQQDNLIFMDTLSYRLNDKLGDHDLKTGFEFNRSRGPRTINISFNGAFTFLRPVTFNPNDPSTFPELFTMSIGEEALHRDLDIYSAFVEDQWRVKSNLTIALGLRYDLQLLGGDLNGRPPPSDVPVEQFWQRFVAGDLKGINFRAYPNDRNNLAPRVGMAWDPRGNGRTVVRAGFGLFYDVIWTNDTGNVVQNYPDVFVRKFANDVRVTRIPNSFFPNVPPPALLSPQGSTSVDMPNPGAMNPLTEQLSVGAQRQIGASLALSADFVYSLGLHYPRVWNVNAIRPDGSYPLEPQGTIMVVNDFGNRLQARQVQLKLDRRSTDRLSYRAAYTWMKVRTFATPVDDDNRNADWGPANNDVRHRVVLSSSYTVPRIDVRLGGILTAASAPPYDIITGFDTNRNRRTNERPLDASGRMRGPNSGRGDEYFNVDLRVSKLFRLVGRRRLELIWETFNLTNARNFGGFIGNMRSPDFGKPTYALSPFQGQLGIRFDF